MRATGPVTQISNGWLACNSSCVFSLHEPCVLQALAQSQSRAVQHHIQVGGGNADGRTNLGRVEFDKFLHHEHPGLVAGQAFQARLKHFPELVLVQGALRVAPGGGLLISLPKPLLIK